MPLLGTADTPYARSALRQRCLSQSLQLSTDLVLDTSKLLKRYGLERTSWWNVVSQTVCFLHLGIDRLRVTQP